MESKPSSRTRIVDFCPRTFSNSLEIYTKENMSLESNVGDAILSQTALSLQQSALPPIVSSSSKSMLKPSSLDNPTQDGDASLVLEPTKDDHHWSNPSLNKGPSDAVASGTPASSGWGEGGQATPLRNVSVTPSGSHKEQRASVRQESPETKQILTQEQEIFTKMTASALTAGNATQVTQRSSQEHSPSLIIENRVSNTSEEKESKEMSSRSRTSLSLMVKSRKVQRSSPHPSSSNRYIRGSVGMQRSNRLGATTTRKEDVNRLEITNKWLAKINYESIQKGNSKKRSKWRSIMSEFLKAHKGSMKELEQYWWDEMQDIVDLFHKESFKPHQAEINRLISENKRLSSEYSDKLQFAFNLCGTILNDVNVLLSEVQKAGKHLCDEVRLLDFQSNFLRSDEDASNTKGKIMEELRGSVELSQHDNSPPAVPAPTETDLRDSKLIESFFNRSLWTPEQSAAGWPPVGLLPMPCCEDEAQRPTPEPHLLTISDWLLRQLQNPNEGTNWLHNKLNELSAAFVKVLQRSEQQTKRYHDKTKALQTILDECATRQKLSDDILKGCIEQYDHEMFNSIAAVRELQRELRDRMDRIEASLMTTLDNCIRQSAALCVDDGDDDGYEVGGCGLVAPSSFHRGQQRQLKREEGLRDFLHGMARAAQEQASMLGAAQDLVLGLWRGRRYEGREETATHLSRALPAAYAAQLEACDRATLLRLLHHLSLRNDGAACALMGALDEHQRCLDTHPAEAAITLAAREEEEKKSRGKGKGDEKEEGAGGRGGELSVAAVQWEAGAANPSARDVVPASVVGEGRWGGRAPVRSFLATGTPLPDTAAAPLEYFETNTRKAPPPAVPRRPKLLLHVLGSYNHTLEELLGGEDGK